MLATLLPLHLSASGYNTNPNHQAILCVVRCDGLRWVCHSFVTDLSLEHPPGEGVGPVHSREVPLPLTRSEIRKSRSPLRCRRPISVLTLVTGDTGPVDNKQNPDNG